MSPDPEEMIRPAISAYNAAIMACDKAGQWEQALGLFRAMPRQHSDRFECFLVTQHIPTPPTKRKTPFHPFAYAKGSCRVDPSTMPSYLEP